MTSLKTYARPMVDDFGDRYVDILTGFFDFLIYVKLCVSFQRISENGFMIVIFRQYLRLCKIHHFC